MCFLKRQKYAVARIFSARGLAAMGRLRKGVFLIKNTSGALGFCHVFPFIFVHANHIKSRFTRPPRHESFRYLPFSPLGDF